MTHKGKVSSPKKAKSKTDKRLSKHNYEFDVYNDIWTLNASHKLNFGLISSFRITPKLEKCIRLTLADYACEFSSFYTKHISYIVRKILSFGVIDIIREEHILNFKSTLTTETEWKLGAVRGFLLDCFDNELGGVDAKVPALLQSLKIKGSIKGKAVATGCPYSGAYSFEEQTAFIDWYVNAYTDNLITLNEYAFITALQMTGARPIQLSFLHYGDLVTRTLEGVQHFDLNLPNAKKPDEGYRDSFQLKKDINEDLMLVLNAKSKHAVGLVEEHFGINLSDEEKKIVPIFIYEEGLVSVSNFEDFSAITSGKPDFLCIRKSGVGAIVTRVSRLCTLKTNRIMINGEAGDLHINPRRFRYTHATNMAILGASDLAIAAELGHSDNQNVKVYTEFKEEIALRLDDALESSLVPLAQAFSGTLIDSKKDAIRANDPRSRVNNSEGNAVGNCGKFGFCANGTIHCYTCNKFQPWVNAPHQNVLDTVVSERDKKRNMGASEFVLQSHNRSIDAIKVVIHQCEVRKEELKNEGAIDV